jgi:CspA family cold shock protein
MSEGKVKWFNTRKGYGFISTDDGADIFVHYSNIAAEGYKTLAEGDAVTFDVVEGEKGQRAENVIPKAALKTKPAPKAKAAPKRKSAKSKVASEGEEVAETKEAVESEEAPETEEAPESESDAETQ